ncbi:hypothetical protein B0J11DRAFT_536850 [Dendryphion nanum]|uniref:Uncharacterized protein n=1 Tax=Dendryphion nanum TaxID=256645 RepID=A0A9P9IDN5_9PLEO|nr:hypothetical protein B0J11DRAFT_536850 [Dendryphion nanum]
MGDLKSDFYFPPRMWTRNGRDGRWGNGNGNGKGNVLGNLGIRGGVGGVSGGWVVVANKNGSEGGWGGGNGLVNVMIEGGGGGGSLISEGNAYVRVTVTVTVPGGAGDGGTIVMSACVPVVVMLGGCENEDEVDLVVSGGATGSEDVGGCFVGFGFGLWGSSVVVLLVEVGVEVVIRLVDVDEPIALVRFDNVCVLTPVPFPVVVLVEVGVVVVVVFPCGCVVLGNSFAGVQKLMSGVWGPRGRGNHCRECVM